MLQEVLWTSHLAVMLPDGDLEGPVGDFVDRFVGLGGFGWHRMLLDGDVENRVAAAYAPNSRTGPRPLSLRMALATVLNSCSIWATDCQRASRSICLVNTPSLSVRSFQPSSAS